MNCFRQFSRHPFAVEAHFRKSLVVGFAAPRCELEKLLPTPFAVDPVDEDLGFLAAALVDTRGLRPKGFPRIFGRDFILLGYRIFVRFRNQDGRNLRGLYILGSETNRHSMKWLGSLFTHYRYAHTGIEWSEEGETDLVRSDSGLRVVASPCEAIDDLPVDSPFASWREARRFAGPMPYSFSYDETAKQVISIHGVRSDWQPQPMRVEEVHVPFFESVGLTEMRVANAFLLRDIPYYWKKGVVESWEG